MASFEDEKKGNLIIGVNYIDMMTDFEIIKEAEATIKKRLEDAAIKKLHFRPERRKTERRDSSEIEQ